MADTTITIHPGCKMELERLIPIEQCHSCFKNGEELPFNIDPRGRSKAFENQKKPDLIWLPIFMEIKFSYENARFLLDTSNGRK